MLVPSLALIAIGLLLFARTPVGGHFARDLLPVMLFLGVGAGLSFAAVMTLAMSGATPQDAGLASGLVNSSVQVGGAIGLAVLATLAAERTNALRAAGEATDAALNGGYHLAYLIGAALLGVAVLVAIFVVRAPATELAQPEAEPVLAAVE